MPLLLSAHGYSTYIEEAKMNLTMNEKDLDQMKSNLTSFNEAVDKMYPGDSADRQPVQTVYGGATYLNLIRPKLSELSIKFWITTRQM